MDTITHAQLRELATAGRPPAVSLFMPTHRAGSGARQDPIEFKNLLRDAETKLIERGMRPTEARDLLKPAQDMLDDLTIWDNGQEGLAVFLSPGDFLPYRLPIAPVAQAIVNDRFHVKPLLPILADREFFVVAVSQHDVRLLRCTRTSCESIPLPKDVETKIENIREDAGEHATVTQRNAGGLGGGAGQGAAGTFHGESVEVNQRHAEDVRFLFRQMEDGIRRAAEIGDAQVVLAGDIHVTPVYREVSKFKNIAEETIRGNPENVADSALHEKALEILQPVWHKELNSEQETFGNALAQGKASHNVREIVLAAMDGRVNTLFVAPEELRWGRVDEEARTVELHEAESPEGEDVLDWATVRTIQTSGRVIVVSPDAVPGNGPIAAVMRY